MLIFDVSYNYMITLNGEDIDEELTEKQRQRKLLGTVNEFLGAKVGLDGRFSAFGHRIDASTVSFLICREADTEEEWEKYLRSTVHSYSSMLLLDEKHCKSITAKEAVSIHRKASRMSVDTFLGYFPVAAGIDYFGCNEFDVKEECAKEAESYESIAEKCRRGIYDSSLEEELTRIYSPNNVKEFKGHPVHYMIHVDKNDNATAVVEMLVSSLLANKRLVGNRVCHVKEITANCYDEESLDMLFSSSAGNAVVIYTSALDNYDSNFATTYMRVVEEFEKKIRRYSKDTLFIVVDSFKEPGFAVKLTSRLVGEVDFIEIMDGIGDIEKAAICFTELAEKEGRSVDADEVRRVLKRKQRYRLSDVKEVYNIWVASQLKEKYYKEYRNCKMLKVEKEEKKSKPYEELKHMVGLEKIKQLVDDIIGNGKIRVLRKKAGMKVSGSSMHMIFTGNPGSAKTSVARLIASILKEEKIIESGAYVECGRADLVAKYVGWTAKTIKQKFAEARGGVLFIDEAYALVDGSNSFGDEAINTIVQEMENHRDDVIVIFAGYPDKMEEFLKKNEGLRSRIAYHLSFPDYNAEELYEITRLFAKNSGYKLGKGVKEKCIAIYRDACHKADFGNGRFARNLFEQACMHQSNRLIKKYGKKRIPRVRICELLPEDFEVNASQCYSRSGTVFGFAG